MTRFAVAVQQGVLIQPATWAVVSTRHVQVSATGWYGYGFDDDYTAGTRILGHDGGVPGFDARVEIYVETGVTVVVLANYDRPAAQDVADALRGYLTTTAARELLSGTASHEAA
jgi:Beta-lactamase